MRPTRDQWLNWALILLLPVPLLAPAFPLRASCLDEVRQEYAETLAVLKPHASPETWIDLIPAPGVPGRAAVLTVIADAYIDQARYSEAESWFDRAVGEWLLEGYISGELCARRLLAFSEHRRGAFAEALATISIAEARARDTGVHTQLNHIVYTKIRQQLNLNERLEEALLQLEQHPPDDDAMERLLWTDTRANLLSRLGRLHQAKAGYERVIEQATDLGQDVLRGAAYRNRNRMRYRLVRASLEPVDLADIVSETRRDIDDPAILPRAKLQAMLFLAQMQSDDAALTTLESCRRVGMDTGHTGLAGACMADRAVMQASRQPVEAARLMDEAVALVERDATAQDHQRLVWSRIQLDWLLHPPPEAMRRSLRYLEATEAMRMQQTGGEARAQFLALWSGTNRMLAALAYAHADAHPELLSPAFTVLEDMRARVLRELRLDAGDADEQARAVARRISEIQRALLDTAGDADTGDGLHEQLGRLDLEYRQALLKQPETIPSPGPPPDLKTLQAALAPGEALLSALTDTALRETRDLGWIHVITRDRSFAVRIPGHLQLAQWSRTLNGLGNWSAPDARRMFDIAGSALLEPLLHRLPEQTKRLILVADRGLHNLPLAAMPMPGGRPLGTAFELEIAPSAGLWLALRESRKARGSALVLADPELPVDGYRRLDPIFAERLEPLPSARGEAKRIRARLKSGAKVLLGAAASEQLFSERSLDGHSLLHFGTHTLIHPTVPYRSAILLAPSGPETDGLLQPREIQHLDLDGRATILAVCSGAAGEWVDGEGLLSLARAFIAAGAPAVVASRWPVDDRHAQVFFDRVYRGLARGQTLSAALSRAGRGLHEAGYPAEAWAGYVLIGDGAWSPIEPSRPWFGIVWLLAGALLLIAAGCLAWRR